MDQGQGDEEDLGAKYFEFAEQFLALSDDENGQSGTYVAIDDPCPTNLSWLLHLWIINSRCHNLSLFRVRSLPSRNAFSLRTFLPAPQRENSAWSRSRTRASLRGRGGQGRSGRRVCRSIPGICAFTTRKSVVSVITSICNTL